jgi:hypothetical protein
VVNVLDIQKASAQVNGTFPCTNGDINQSGVCDSADVMRVNTAALGSGCVVGPGPELTITGPAALPQGTVGSPYNSISLGAASGTGGYTWSASGLPNGMILSASGVLSGTPAPGSQGSTLQFTVKDSSGATASYGLPLTINSAPILTVSCNEPNTHADVGGGPVRW